MTCAVAVLLVLASPVQPRVLTYVIDYSGAPLSDPAYAARYAAYPPDLLHLGVNASPLPSYWFGREAEPDPSPQAVRDLAERLQARVDELHQVGVRLVMPYLCAITIGGDPDGRLGWFGFFDHWDDYAAFGLGPKPPADPLEWLQRKPDGQPRFYYAFDHPPYRPLHRYAVAPANPWWQQWLGAVARNMAAAGFDGTFVDNPTNADFGPDAQREFRRWVEQSVPEAVRREVWPDGNVALVDELRTPAGALSQRFHAVSMADLLAVVGEGGASGGRPGFVVNPNAAGWAQSGYRRGWDLREMNRAVGLAMDEGATWPGVVSEDFGGVLSRRTVRDNLFSYLRGAMRGRAPIDCLATRGSLVSDDQLLLAAAGAAAFGGVWVHRWIDDPREDGWERFVAFARGHRDLFDGLEPAAQVAVAYSTPDLTAGFEDHFDRCSALVHLLLREQVPCRLVELADATLEELRAYPLVVLPQVQCLSAAEVECLDDYVTGGGRIVAVGPTGTHDELAREEAEPALDALPAHRVARFAEWPSTPADWLAVRQAVAAALPGGGSVASEQELPGLRLAWWRTADGGRQVVHVLNYGVSATAGAGPLVPLPAFDLALPGLKPAAARLFVPGAEPVALAVQNGVVQVPAVPVYGVVEWTGVDRVDAAPPVTVAALKPDVPQYAAGAAPRLAPAAAWAGMPTFATGPTRWRFAQTMLLQAVEARLVVQIRPVDEGYGGTCQAVLLDSDGRVVAERSGSFGATFELEAAGARAGEVYVLLVDPGRNAVEVETEAPLTVQGQAQVLNVNGRVRRLYFQVPAGLAQFTLTASADSPGETATLALLRPDGTEVGRLAGELDQPEKLQVEVGQDAGRLWSLTLASGPTGSLQDVKLVLDERVPARVADDPTRLLLPQP